MRISSSQRYDEMRYYLQVADARLFRLQQQLASGKKIQQPSDDPLSAVGLLTFQEAQKLSEQHLSNARNALGRFALIEDALGQIAGVFQKARTVALQGANDALEEAGRDALVQEIQHLQESLLESANTRDGEGRFLFSGLQVNTEPFVLNSNPPPALSYQGDDGQNYIEVGSDFSLPGNMVIAQEVVGAYEVLEELKTSLSNGETEVISEVVLPKIDDSLRQFNALRGTAGQLMSQFQTASDISQRRVDLFAEELSKRGDADYAETVVEFQTAQLAYQAALAALSAGMRVSLLDFLQ
ncbi:MAG TPA: flagellar hook-associated protein FlgL [Fimbriimonadales bacterium]|nr:flagellar hook-associated protein FlgL [Fimbriimonadales bacterium]